MTSSKSIFSVLMSALLAAFVMGCALQKNDEKSATPSLMPPFINELPKDQPMPPSAKSPENKPSLPMAFQGELIAGKSAPLLEFNQDDYDKANDAGKLIVLYFYANWCPICKAEFPVMIDAFSQLTSDQVVGFRVNFNDNETSVDEEALARDFGVAYQHTKVFVRTGRQILKAPDGWDLNRYKTEINNNL